jgi:excisionase family DNA binding protein
MTVKDIMNTLRVSHTCVIRWIHRGVLPAKLVNRRYDIDKADLEAYLEKNNAIFKS